MERGKTIDNRMTVVFPLSLEKCSKVLRFEVGFPTRRESLPLRLLVFQDDSDFIISFCRKPLTMIRVSGEIGVTLS